MTEEKYLYNQNLLFDFKTNFLKKKVTAVEYVIFVVASMVGMLNDILPIATHNIFIKECHPMYQFWLVAI